MSPRGRVSARVRCPDTSSAHFLTDPILVDGREYGRGTGSTKQLGRNSAARAALERLMLEAEPQTEPAEGN